MNPKVVSSIAVVLLALLGTGASQAWAQAPTRGAVVIENPTPEPINYQVRWGNGPWQSFRVLPGQEGRHWHLLNAGGQAPRPQIRFDGVGNGWLLYDLQYFSVNAPVNGKPYTFRYSANGRNLDLYAR